MKKLLLLLLLISSCATHKTEYTFVKVLGVTHAGDTVLIDVNSLRPRVYNTYQYRNSVPYYNYIPLTPQFIIRPTRPVIIPTPPVVRPTPIKPIPTPKPIILKKGK